MTRSDVFKAAYAITRTLMAPGISYRATFGLVLRHIAQEAVIMNTPVTRTFEIVDLQEITRRKTDGSVAFVKAGIRDGAAVVAYQSSGKMTDGAEHVLVVDGDRLTIGGKHLAGFEAGLVRIAEAAAFRDKVAAEKAALDADAIALLPMLPAIVGASEKQIAYATRIREERFVLAMRACSRQAAIHPSTAGDMDLIRAELRTNVEARFWLDIVENTDGGHFPSHALGPIARYMHAAGRVPARTA